MTLCVISAREVCLHKSLMEEVRAFLARQIRLAQVECFHVSLVSLRRETRVLFVIQALSRVSLEIRPVQTVPRIPCAPHWISPVEPATLSMEPTVLLVIRALSKILREISPAQTVPRTPCAPLPTLLVMPVTFLMGPAALLVTQEPLRLSLEIRVAQIVPQMPRAP